MTFERAWRDREIHVSAVCRLTVFSLGQVKSSLYINNRQPYGSLSNVLRRPVEEVWRKGRT